MHACNKFSINASTNIPKNFLAPAMHLAKGKAETKCRRKSLKQKKKFLYAIDMNKSGLIWSEDVTLIHIRKETFIYKTLEKSWKSSHPSLYTSSMSLTL